MKFAMYDRVTEEIMMMEFENLLTMWNWHDIKKGRYVPYDEFGNRIYRVCIIK